MKDIALIVQGSFFGDEKKGGWVDYLTAKFSKNLVIRFNGGANAAHNVLVDNVHHCFSQFGSGTFSGADTLLSQFTLVEPLALEIEAQILQPKLGYNSLKHVFIDSRAKLITPFHILANRLNSKSGSTTGMGIGVTMQDSLDRPARYLTIGDVFKSGFGDKLVETKEYILDTYPDNKAYHKVSIPSLIKKYWKILSQVEILDAADTNYLVDERSIIFEGAQGILLDENKGFHPYTTWSTTTKDNALRILADAGIKEHYTFGATRIYGTRHGDGVFPTFDEYLTKILPEPHNTYNESQGNFRNGWLDTVLLQYAISANGGVDSLLVSHCDMLNIVDSWQLPNVYCDLEIPTTLEEQAALTKKLESVNLQYEMIKAKHYLHEIANRLSKPIFGISYGQGRKDSKCLVID